MGLPVEVNNLMLGSLGGYTVGRSLRFRSSASAYLNRTPSSTTNQKTWTYSFWIKRGVLGSTQAVFSANVSTSGNTQEFFYFRSDNTIQYTSILQGTAAYIDLYTTPVLRDPSAWYHIVVAIDTTQATASNRAKIYVNGVQITAFSTATYPSQNYNTSINTASVPNYIGWRSGASEYTDAYYAEVNFIDGQALTPSSFGAYDTNGVWQPKKYSGTYGTNGFYLPFTSGFNTTQAYAGSFNGSNQFLSVASSASLSPSTGDFTVEANINLNTLPSSNSYAAIFENQIATTSASSDKFYVAVKNNAGTYRLEIGQHSTANVAYVNWTPTIGTWYHVAVVRQSGTILLFINGVQQTVTNSTVFNGTNFGQNGASIGAISTPLYFNGYISNARYVVGSAVYTTGFIPPSSNLTNITNTQWLTLQNATIIDNSSAARTITNNGSVVTSNQYPFQYTLASISADYSGNNNNWTTNNINATFLGTTYDSMIDSPTNAAGTSTGIGNYAVMNPNFVTPSTTFSNGNLTLTKTGATDVIATSTISMPSSKWYWEITITSLSASSNLGIGIIKNTATNGSWASPNTSATVYFNSGGGVYRYGSNITGTLGTTFATNDVLGLALDMDAGTLALYKNNTLIYTVSGVDTATPHYAFWDSYANGESASINFGQRPFTYTPPTGYKALNTYNLPAPSIANGAQYMAATTYTGNGSTQSINNGTNTTIGTTFQPDFVWAKIRSTTGNHSNYDSVRGAQQWISANLTNAEGTYPGVTAFNSNGFSIGSDGGVNTNSATYVAWQWKGGGTGVTNTSGTITSTVSASASSGFSVATYTGTGANATVGHGLGVAPSMVIVKPRVVVDNWNVYHASNSASPATQVLYLNLTNATSTNATIWNNTAPTSSVFSIGTNTGINTNGSTYVAYCFSAVSGYSAFGKWTGNGSSDGPFVFTNFRPRYVMWKRTDVSGDGWWIVDSSRNTYNVATQLLFAQSSTSETAITTPIDFLSNGFKLRNGADGSINGSGGTYIYMAFAENPFSIARAR